MRRIEDVLDEMIGFNYMITQAQIQEIREIHRIELKEAKADCQSSYEAGRKHDLAAVRLIMLKYEEV